MTFEEHLTEFAGLMVADFPVARSAPVPMLFAPDSVAWRVRVGTGWDRVANTDEDFTARFTAFREQIDTSLVRALIIGPTTSEDEFDSETPVALLAEHAARFPNLRAIFLGDLVREESDVAYIGHEDLMPILESYPRLEEFRVRGSNGYDAPGAGIVRPFKHESLRTLVFESGGLDPAVIRAVGESEIPELEHLEFYFGEEHYGGGAGIEDTAWLLNGERFPKLRHLGLRDAPNQDEIAAALAHAPIVARLETLDLSLGTLSDEGAAALLAGQPLTHLKRLDLHHHFMSEEMSRRLHEALPDVELDLSDRQEPSGWRGESRRYIAVSE